tara:strand:+ start:3213 stop:3962 length:750 start_codon:yes stop_codon:yes gene_type:complete
MPKLNERININPVYQDALNPLTEQESSQLEMNILQEGAFLSPILYHLSDDGEEVVVDGHHRYAIWESHKEDKELEWPSFREVTELSGAPEGEVVEWIRNHQKGRRNAPSLLEQYEMGQDVLEVRENGGTIKGYADENEVSASQAGHAANLAKTIDEADGESPGFKDQILGDDAASASGAIQAAKDLNATEPSPLMAFEAVQSLIGKLSRAVMKVKQAFPEVHDWDVPDTISALGEDVRNWEDVCSKEVE